ncbi:CBS domain-containing protein [Streptomyces sp. NPDC018019]|uniref:CBS domain-containing protein n=1 Tax=Streptomyces sp. NPDC018019 TaxID=3365030 RepID=UPI0037AC904B
MTVIQIRPCSAAPAETAPAEAAANNTVAFDSVAFDAVDTAGPQAWDDMTVEVALSVMAGARTKRLLICDDDGQGTRVVTQAELTAVRDDSAYTDQARLRDIPGDGLFAPPPADGHGRVPVSVLR